MRFEIMTALVVVSMVCSSGSFVAAQESQTQDDQSDQEALDILGHRFVDALKEDNIVAHSQCWLPGGVYLVLLQRR